MALEDILRKIRQDAEAEAAAILAEAQAQKEAALAQGKARAESAAERIGAAGMAAAEEARRRELASASVEVRRLVLSAKQDALEQVFDQALTRLADMGDREYGQLLSRLAAEAAATGDELIIVSARDRGRLGEEWLAATNAKVEQRGLPGKLAFADGTRDIRGGLVLQSGDVEVNCSFERTLASLRDGLEPMIAAMLFEPAEGVTRA